jgi:hypothetical protein
MKFSQRIGITPVEKAIQIGSIDAALRNSLWSLLTVLYWNTFDRDKYDFGDRVDYIQASNLRGLFQSLWLHFFKKPIDAIPTYYYDEDGGLAVLRNYFFGAKWYEVYDFIEFVSFYGPEETRDKFVDVCNTYLERENSGYRFVDNKIVEISSTDEVSEIESAIENATPYYGVKQHLSKAITLMSDKKNPDYRNSIKESISAVESLCVTVSNDKKATLGEALKVLEKRGVLHPALKSAFSSLYGYTSDAEGIRHALMEESNLTSADARFMLISCSAFVNYVIASTTKNA